MINNQKLRYGFIGAGNIGQLHMQELSQLENDVELIGVTDVSSELASTRAKEYHIPHVYDTAEDLLGDQNIDVVIIGVPNKYHAPLAIQSLNAGKHVVFEKTDGY